MDTEKLIKSPDNYAALATNDPDEQQDQDLQPKQKWWKAMCLSLKEKTLMPRRYGIAVLAFLGFCNVYMLRVNLSVAIVAMTTTNGQHVAEFNWDSKTQGFILSSFFYGYICTQIPGGWLSAKFGGKKVFGIGLIFTSILSMITPMACKSGQATALVIVRILQGLAEGVTYPAIHEVWSKWSPASERSRLATIAFSGSYIGTVISLSVSGFIAQHYGWSWIFYTFGLVALIWAIYWLSTVGETPAEDLRISEVEINFINSSLGGPPTHIRKAPWFNMLTSGPVWAINVAHFAENWGFYTLLTLLPKYMKNMFNMELSVSGILSALPYLFMALVVQFAGYLADHLRSQRLTTTSVRKIFTCGAFVSQTIFMVFAAYITDAGWAIACLSVAVGLGGFAWAGFSVNHLDIAPQYASLLMGISNTFATVPGMVSPALAGRMVQNGTAEEWRGVFTVSSTIYIIGAGFYGLMASGNLQPWAESASTMDLSSSVDSD